MDHTFFRVAVRSKSDNSRLVQALERFAGVGKPPRAIKARTPAIMIQGTNSNAGKSVIAAALCRIFLQDGLSVAPFKAQNMSLNSYVTRDGLEMGRAQVTQAMACRLDPDVRMNPVLLKPGSDLGSQVIIMGRPIGNMNVQEYVEFKPRAFEAVQRAYDSLAEEYDVIVLEGAGSPAEINLKHHDIVNMKMAEYAGAEVLLVGDIDRGGVFAALTGTMELLNEDERKRVAGFLLNRFRGDEKLLEPALSATFGQTGKRIMGVVPHIHDLGLPEEDSVSFKAGLLPQGATKINYDDCVDIACIDLPRISNFNDLDPLAAEPDVRLRIVKTAHELGQPDAVIIPGSKNTVGDMRAIKGAGMAAALRSLPDTTEIIGICGGYQMLGKTIEDPAGLESESPLVDGIGLLPLHTILHPDKTLTRAVADHHPSGLKIFGYEIHHGVTRPVGDHVREFVTSQGKPLGYGLERGNIWGTYLHGLFDSDDFRRWFVDKLRSRKGLDPLVEPQTLFSLETALDNLASVVRESIDLPGIYEALGFTARRQATLI